LAKNQRKLKIKKKTERRGYNSLDNLS